MIHIIIAFTGAMVAAFMAGHAFAAGLFGWVTIFGILAILDLIYGYYLTKHKL